MLALLRRGPIPCIACLPERSHLIDGFCATHLSEVFEEDRNRLDPMAVAVDDGMFQMIMYLCRAFFHSRSPKTTRVALLDLIIPVHLSHTAIATPPIRQSLNDSRSCLLNLLPLPRS